MANYSKLNFYIPITNDSTSLKIRDIKGNIKYTIYNNRETTFFTSDNKVIIRTEGDLSDIILDFSNRIEAIQALSILNIEFPKIKQNIDNKKQTEFVENVTEIVDDIIDDLGIGGTNGDVNIEAGDGLISSNNTFDVNIGSGLRIINDAVALDISTYVAPSGENISLNTLDGSITISGNSALNLSSNDDINMVCGSHILQAQRIELDSNGGSNKLVIDNGAVYTDNGNGGIKYASDYSSTYTSRSLVDKDYVDTQIDSIAIESTTAGNGLAISGITVKLGGTLTQDTTINGNGNDLTIDVNNLNLNSSTSDVTINTSNGSVNVNSSNNIYLYSGNSSEIGIYSDNALILSSNNSSDINLESQANVNVNAYGGSINLNSDNNVYIYSNNSSEIGIYSDNAFVVETDNGSDISLYSDANVVVESLNNVSITSSNVITNQVPIVNYFNKDLTGFNNDVMVIKLQQDGKLLVGGYFTSYNGNPAPRFVRLNTNGTIDTSFNVGSGFNSIPTTISFETDDNNMIVGGTFTNYNGNSVNYLVEIDPNGNINTGFNSGSSGFNNVVSATAIQSDGKKIIGGHFTTYNGLPCPERLVRLNSNGDIDDSFNNGGSGFEDGVRAIAIQDDGKIVVGGDFTFYNGISCPNKIARLNDDGSIDSSFNFGGSGLDGFVRSIAIESSGKILVGGNFSTYNGVDCPNGLIRLNDDGSIDSITFNSGGSGFNIAGVYSIVVQPDGKILVGGHFSNYNGNPVPGNILRLNTNGLIDATFIGAGFGSNDLIQSVALASDGSVFAGGLILNFNTVDCTDKLIKLNQFGQLTGGGIVTTELNENGLDISSGIILTSPDGTKYRLTIADGGTLSISPL